MNHVIRNESGHVNEPCHAKRTSFVAMVCIAIVRVAMVRVAMVRVSTNHTYGMIIAMDDTFYAFLKKWNS
jgi:hypothetical protein